MTSSATRSLPPRPDLRPLKLEAKRRLAAGEAPTLARIQLVIAREHGFASWARLKQFIEASRLEPAERAAALVRAACAGDMRKATSLLAAEPELARFDLYTACVTGEAARAEQLLARTPALATTAGGPHGRPPILYACFTRFLRAAPERVPGIVTIVRRLLALGADPNSRYLEGEEPQTPLYGAAGIANNPELTALLLAAGADPDDTLPPANPADPESRWGNESLYHAAEFRDATCLRLLLAARPHPVRVSYCLARALDFAHPDATLAFLEHGADPNFRVPWAGNRTHFMKAVINGRPPAVIEAMLRAGADPAATDARGKTAYDHAVRLGHEAIAALIERARPGIAAGDEDRAVGDLLLGRGPAAALPAPLDPALLSRAASRNDLASIRRLLDAGAAIDALAHGMAPLHAAVWSGHREACELLLARGASVHVVNLYGGNALATALHGSANCHDPEGGVSMRLPEEIDHGDYPGIVELLLQHGAPLPAQIEEGSEAVRAVLRRHGVPDPA